MRPLLIFFLMAGAANAQGGNSQATENFISILGRSMDQETPAYMQIGDGPCWETVIEGIDGDLTFGGGQGPAPRIVADRSGPMLLLDGTFDQVGGASYIVLRASKATTAPTGTILRPVALCRDAEGAPQCTRNIGGLRQFSLKISSDKLCE
jgi:hypothetical protein